jgi:hypothetical protein
VMFFGPEPVRPASGDLGIRLRKPHLCDVPEL